MFHSNLSIKNRCYYLRFRIAVMQRHFFRRTSQKLENLERFCKYLYNPFDFACRKWYLDNQSPRKLVWVFQIFSCKRYYNSSWSNKFIISPSPKFIIHPNLIISSSFIFIIPLNFHCFLLNSCCFLCSFQFFF